MSVNVHITLYIDTPTETTDIKQLEATLRCFLTGSATENGVKEIAIQNPLTGKHNYRNMSIAKFEVE